MNLEETGDEDVIPRRPRPQASYAWLWWSFGGALLVVVILCAGLPRGQVQRADDASLMLTTLGVPDVDRETAGGRLFEYRRQGVSMTFVREAGEWKGVAMQDSATGRPLEWAEVKARFAKK